MKKCHIFTQRTASITASAARCLAPPTAPAHAARVPGHPPSSFLLPRCVTKPALGEQQNSRTPPPPRTSGLPPGATSKSNGEMLPNLGQALFVSERNRSISLRILLLRIKARVHSGHGVISAHIIRPNQVSCHCGCTYAQTSSAQQHTPMRPL